MSCKSCRSAKGQLHNAKARSVTRSRHSCFTTTSVNQTCELEEALGLLPPVGEDGVKCWCDLHSLEALRLTLPHIAESCKLPNQHILEEYPFAKHMTPLGTIKRVASSSLGPAKPQAHLDEDKLRQKRRQLKLLITFYENRIHKLCTDSNRYFGVLKGSKLVFLVETSQNLAQQSDGKFFTEYKESLKLLVNEQLVNKEAVYFLQFGTTIAPSSPQPIPFEVNRTQCKSFAHQWINALNGEGSCNLLAAVKLALSLKEIDTICVVLCSQPNQDLSMIHDHLTDKLTGYESPKLHLVAFESTKQINETFTWMATSLKGHFHIYNSINSKSPDAIGEHKPYTVEDTDIDRVRREIEKTKQVLHELHNLREGVVKDPLLSVLRELSLTTEWAEDDDFQLPSPPTEAHALPRPSLEWLEHHGLECHGLNLYKVLAPNAYPQLDGHVQVTDGRVLSQVYDVMPLFTWHDGTNKYLHVDVHGLENYTKQLESFIADVLEPRLGWLLSGSRMPFGVLTEQRVLLVLDGSFDVLAQILVLQQHLKTLLQEQLSLVEEFNMMSFGKDCQTWTVGFAEPNKQSLREAWEFVLGMSPSGTCDLLAALRMIFESNQLFENVDQLDDVGVYLIVSSMPDQDEEMLCSYVEQILTGRTESMKIHVVYYNMEHLAHNLVVPGREGGRYGSSEQVEKCLERIARTSGGRFHSFKASGSAQGDDIKVILAELSLAHSYLETANNILQHYRDFCKRNVPLLEPRCVSPGQFSAKPVTPPPPLYPRQTAASLARMNACQHRRSESPTLNKSWPMSADSDSTNKGGKSRSKRLCLKTQPFYTGHGLKKGIALGALEKSKVTKAKQLIPNREAYISSRDWLSKYSADALRLKFEEFLPSNKCKKTTHTHINPQGEHILLCVSHQGLKNYLTQLMTVLNRYRRRTEWLQKDEHKYFGTILEGSVVFILDGSSSMCSHWSEVKDGVQTTLNHFPVHVKRFNVIVYTSTVKMWKEQSATPTKESVEDATLWLESLKSGGSSCLLEAFKAALLSRAEGIYLVTDGEADHTHEFLLNQLPKLRQQFGQQWTLHATAFYCTSNEPESFLRTLSHNTGGRFHSFPRFSLGDDITLLEKEIQTIQNYISKTRTLL